MTRTPQAPCSCQPKGAATFLFAARDYISGDTFQIVRCGICALAFTEPIPQHQEWERYYPRTYYGEPGSSRFPAIVERLQDALYAQRARQLEKLNGGAGSVLDVGCGRGLLLRAFQRRGWRVTGTEMSESAAAHAVAKLNLPVHIGSLEKLNLPENSFDAVVMWHVLEHFSQPHDILREVHRVLRPGGLFLVAVPDFGSLEARLARDKWFHLDVPRHLTHFTRCALGRCLEQKGFRIEMTLSRSLEYDSFSAMQSLFNRLGLRHNWLYNRLRRTTAQAAAKQIAQALAHLLLLPVAIVAGLLPLFAGGSTTVLYARKN